MDVLRSPAKAVCILGYTIFQGVSCPQMTPSRCEWARCRRSGVRLRGTTSSSQGLDEMGLPLISMVSWDALGAGAACRPQPTSLWLCLLALFGSPASSSPQPALGPTVIGAGAAGIGVPAYLQGGHGIKELLGVGGPF